MHNHTSFAIMAAVLLPAIVTLTLYPISKANAQGNETSTTGGQEHNVINATGGQEHNVINATGGQEHNVINETQVEVAPGNR